MSGKGAVLEPGELTPLSPQKAFREVCRRFGMKEMAAQLLISEGVLQNKCHTDEGSHHKPTLMDVVNVTRISGDTTILESLDRMFGRAGYEVGPGDGSDAALLELLCKVASESGDMHRALANGYEDGKFTLEKFKAVRAEAYDLISAVQNFLQRLEGNVDA